MLLFRYQRLFYICLMVGVVALTYQIKYDVQKKIIVYNELQQKTEQLENQLHLLKIEQSLLNQPDRLNYLAQHYVSQLQLQPVEAAQFIKIQDIPLKNQNTSHAKLSSSVTSLVYP